MRLRWTATLAVRLCLAVAIWAQEKKSSTRDGVFTAAQAERGGASYTKSCLSCHGDDLQGGGPTPPLAGPDFLNTWKGATVGEFFDRIQTSMPADKPGKLARAENADIVAYILSFNKLPGGSGELPDDAEKLKRIRFDAPVEAK